MEKYWIFVHLVMSFISTALCVSPPSVSKVYRKDYVYNKRTDAFYKLHIESRRGWSCNSVCQCEGASLMAPSSQDDIVQLHGMFKQFPDLGEYVWVAPDGQDHESAEEPAIINLTPEVDDTVPYQGGCDVVSRKGEIDSMPCFRRLPFICKVNAKEAPYDPHCDLYANNYQYNATVGSCYKISRRAASWNEAYAECRAEGAHLVVLNSEAERAVVQDLMRSSSKVEGSHASWFFFAGFRADQPVGNETLVFKTIFNQTLQEAGFAEWSPNEPNNSAGNEFCGTLFKNDGKLNDVFCANQYAFICEKEVQT